MASSAPARILKKLLRPNLILLWILAAMVAVFSLRTSTFLDSENILEVLRSCGIIALMVLGVTWIVALGDIDVSFPQNAALSSMVTALAVQRGWSWPVAAVLAVAVAIPFGFLSGFLVSKFRFPALIATIAVGGVSGSLANMINKGQPLYLAYINPVVNDIVYGRLWGIPVLFLIVVAIYLVAMWIQDRTTTGQYIYALGENRAAALEAGINEEKIIWSAFTLSALLSGVSGIILAASFTSGQPRVGGSFFIDGLTTVFLGAMIVKMGKPNVIGTLLGAIIIAVLTNGLTMMNVPYYVGSIIKGVMMIIGVAAIIVFRKKSTVRHVKEAEGAASA